MSSVVNALTYMSKLRKDCKKIVKLYNYLLQTADGLIEGTAKKSVKMAWKPDEKFVKPVGKLDTCYVSVVVAEVVVGFLVAAAHPEKPCNCWSVLLLKVNFLVLNDAYVAWFPSTDIV